MMKAVTDVGPYPEEKDLKGKVKAPNCDFIISLNASEENRTKPSAELVFKDVSVTADNEKILTNINGVVKPGEILALMGPSGSGKTTLLNFISYRHELIGIGHKGLSGTVKINDKLVSKKDKRRIGYVMQDDYFFPSLSLWETLKFYATVRLPKSMSQKSKELKLMELIKFFNLDNSLQTCMGDGFIRGLSGGEKKRANIIVEMITDPELLFLDEPTSGLDSNMAMSLITTLKDIANETNKTIIASIHQPNSHIFFSFSNLLLLSHGKIVYFGLVSDVTAHFENLGLPCPPNWNIADHIIDMARSEQKVIDILIEGSEAKCRSRDEGNSHVKTPVQPETEDCKSKKKKKVSKNMSSYGTQFNSLLRRSFYNSINEVWTITDLVKNLVISIIIGIVFYKTSINDRGIQNFLGLMFFMAVNIFQEPMFVNIFKFAPELVIIRKERMSGMYQLSAYYLGKLVSDLLILIVRPFIVWSIVYFMAGLNCSCWYFASLLHMFLVSFHGQALGLLIASFGLGRHEAITITVVFFVFIMLLGGFFNKNVPVWLSWAKYISPFHYAFVIQSWIQLLANKGLPCVMGLPNKDGYIEPSPFSNCLNASSRISSEEAILMTGSFIHPGYYALITVVYIFILHVSAFFSLRRTLIRTTDSKTIEEKLIRYAHKNRSEKNHNFPHPNK